MVSIEGKKRKKRKEIKGKGNRKKGKCKGFLREENCSTTAAETKRKNSILTIQEGEKITQYRSPESFHSSSH